MKPKLLLLLLFVLSIGNAQVTSGLIQHFKFDNSYSNEAGTVAFSATSFATDRSGHPNSAIRITNSLQSQAIISGLPYGNAARTISFWARAQSYAGLNYDPVFTYGTGTAGNACGGAFSQDRTMFVSHTDNFTLIMGGNQNLVGTWYHFVMTYDGTTAKMYRNGQLLGSLAKTWNTINNGDIFKLGVGTGGEQWFNGMIDDLKIYDRAVSDIEAVQIYNEPNTNSIGLIRSFSFNNSAFDDSNSVDFTTSNASHPMTYTTGRNGAAGQALVTTASATRVCTIPDLPLGVRDRAISMWYMHTTFSPITSYASFSYGGSAQYNTFGFYCDVSNVYFQGYAYDQNFSNATPTPYQWYHAVVVFETGIAKIYINGVLKGTVARQLLNTTLTSFRIGNFAGAVDDLKIYDRALSQADVTNLYTYNILNPVTPTFTQIAPQCSGATFSLPTTSDNGITGTWAPAVNNTATTTYTFTPTAGQSATGATMTVTIITNPNVTPNFPPFSSICEGAALAPLPTTSPNGVTGTWSPALNNMATTTYTFVPNPGQCSINATRIINVTPNVTPTFTQIAPICTGASLILPSVSNESISGTWSPALNNMATTTYTFTPNGSQCAVTTTMTVTILPGVSPIFTQINPICSGGTFVLPATSNNGISGTWSPAINNTATTTYTFTPTNGQCPVTMTVAVNQNQTALFNQVPAICAGATLAPLPTTSINFITGTWSPALNNMATTTYTFAPTDGQCATATMTITVNPGTTPTFNPVAPICSGAALSPLPITSANGITGTWSPALNNTATTTYTFTPNAGQCAGTATLTITVNPSVTPSFAAVSPICSGAALSPLPITSANGITGTWSPALNNTATTTYTFTPNAGQCAGTATLTITVNPSVTPSFAAVSPICSGATLSPLPTTSTNGITGTWSPALNNTATTTYTFTPTAGQCATTQTLTIPVNPNVVPTFAAVSPICSGAALSPLPTTSTNGITGTWSPALNNTATTTYTFTPTAGQCATTQTLTIPVNPNVVPTFAAVSPICSGAALSPLPTTSTNEITGTWSPALNNTATTTYTFTPTAGQCATTQTLTITVNTAAAPAGSSAQTFVDGQTIASIVVNPANVIWYASASDAASNTNPLATGTLLVNNTTYYAVNVVGNCRSTAFPVTVTVTLSADDFNHISFTIYPNPADDILNIETRLDLKSVEIYTIHGQKVVIADQNQVDVAHLAAGVYMVKIQDIENNTAIKKIIIK